MYQQFMLSGSISVAEKKGLIKKQGQNISSKKRFFF